MEFSAAASVDADGRYVYRASYVGKLVAVPVDVTQNPPAEAGSPFDAHVGEQQRGTLGAGGAEVSAVTRRLVTGAGGSQWEHRFLRVASDGALRSDVDAVPLNEAIDMARDANAHRLVPECSSCGRGSPRPRGANRRTRARCAERTS